MRSKRFRRREGAGASLSTTPPAQLLRPRVPRSNSLDAFDDSTTFFIEVRRRPEFGQPTCDSYSIQVSNGL